MPGVTASYGATGATPTSPRGEQRIWRAWSDYNRTISLTSGSPTRGICELTWTNWTTHSYSNTSATTTIATSYTDWLHWVEVNDLQNEGAARAVVAKANALTQPTAEQLAAWKAADERAAKAYEEQLRKKREVKERAKKLLVACLTPQQRDDLEKKQCFYLESISLDGSKRRYRIDQGTHGNVKLVDEKGSVIGSYCVQPNGVPEEDAMLAQKLWIETNEEAFKKVANFRSFR